MATINAMNLMIDAQDDVAERAAVLEQIVDAYGLAETISALSIVCAEKADHIKSAWQDVALGSLWQRKAGQLDRISAEAYQQDGLYK